MKSVTSVNNLMFLKQVSRVVKTVQGMENESESVKAAKAHWEAERKEEVVQLLAKHEEELRVRERMIEEQEAELQVSISVPAVVERM